MSESSIHEVDSGPFRLDAPNSRLLREGKPVALTPKAFDVLRYLTSQPDRLVTKRELLSEVWPDVFVSDASIKVCVREIRKALRDSTKVPKYIETVHRRGYRFIAPVAAAKNQSRRMAELAEAPRTSDQLLVGRESEVRRLREQLKKMVEGQRQCVFVTGGPGRGKTALIEAFFDEGPRELHRGVSGVVGHWFAQFCGGEPYMTRGGG